MRIDNHFDIPLPPDAAWTILMQAQHTAACFPGASDIRETGPDQYTGRVTVKLGPLAMLFTGNLRFAERDDASRAAVVNATWSETRGRGNAVTATRFTLHAEGEGTRVAMQTDLQLAGQIAQYGRGTGMIAGISAQLIDTFAQNLRRRIEAGDQAGGARPAEISGLSLIAKALGSRLKG
jgi:uncharacterized protein